MRYINVFCSSVDHWKVSDCLQASFVNVSFLVFGFSFQGFKSGISVYPYEVLFQLQKYRPEKHLRWSHNSSSSPNSCSRNDCHSWLMFGWTVFRHSCDEEPRSSPDICSYILFFSFSLLLKIFLLLNLPCYTSSLSLFATCTIKEQIVLFLLLHNHFWCTLEYIGITRFFWHTLFLLKSCDKWCKVQQHYTILNFLL